MEASIPYKNKNLFYRSLVLLVLSIFDALMTLWGLSMGVIEELNPLMNQILHTSIPLFLLIKIVLPLLFCVLCWQRRYPIRHKLVAWLLKLVIAFYVVGALLHLSWVIKILALL